jgi:arylsulfatase A-like enzyme
MRFVMTWMAWGAVGFGLLGPGVVSVEGAGSKRGTGSRPNVLFIVADDLRDYPGWMGGHPQSVTPNMDALAKRGMRFANAHCNYALCNPSRTSMLTGMLPSSSGVFGNEQEFYINQAAPIYTVYEG